MARRTAAWFGYIFFVVQVVFGLAQGWDPEEVLVRGLFALLVASFVGWTASSLAWELSRNTDRKIGRAHV